MIKASAEAMVGVSGAVLVCDIVVTGFVVAFTRSPLPFTVVVYGSACWGGKEPPFEQHLVLLDLHY